MIRKSIKRVTALSLVLTMSASLMLGCNSKDNNSTTGTNVTTELTTADSVNDKVLSVCGDDVYEDEVMVHMLIQLLDGQVLYSDIKENEENYKNKVTTAIQETKIAYKMSVIDNMEFTDEDIASTNEFISSFKQTVGDEILKAYNINDELISRVFNEYCRSKKYINDTNNSIGKELNDKYLEEYGKYNFQKVYIMTFPKVETQDGQPKEENGSVIKLSDEEIAKVKENCEKAAAEVNAGGTPSEIAEKYGVSAFSDAQLTTSGFNGVVDGFEEGQCSGVLENDNCYYTVSLLIKDDVEDMEMYAYTQAQSEAETKVAAAKEEWKKKVDNPEIVYDGDFWEKYNLIGVAEVLYNKGLLIDESALSSGN